MVNRLYEESGTKVLDKAFQLLSQFDGNHLTFTPSELARATGINRTTVYRLLGSLVQAGYLHAPRPGTYTLGPKLIGLGYVAGRTFDVDAAIEPVLASLRDATRETATFYVQDGTDRRVIAEAVSPHPIRYMDGIGSRFPLAAGAAGRAILALLEDDEISRVIEHVPAYRPTTVTNRETIWSLINAVRQTGIAESWEEYTQGAFSVAAPVHDSHRRLTGAISVTMPVNRFSEPLRPVLHRHVKAAAADLHRRLGVEPPAVMNNKEA